MNRQVLRLAADLHRRHRPFVLATVVWVRKPTSGTRGGTALIETDGTVHGWIGGACAEPAVLREARRLLSDGEPRLMYLGPAEEFDGVTREGVIAVPIACAAEGALEVFMEPVLPQPHVVVVGRSPAVKTLVRLLGALEWRATVVDDGGDGSGFPEGVPVVTEIGGLDSIGIDDTTAVVVATQGHYDEAAVEMTLATPASYVGLVASVPRAETVLGYLGDRGFAEEDLRRRVHTPAGLDLGHVEHREIAVAILAELVALRTSGDIAGAPIADTGPETAVDPVCGMTVEIVGARFLTEHDGATRYFCSRSCRETFEQSPADYATAGGPAGIGGPSRHGQQASA